MVTLPVSYIKSKQVCYILQVTSVLQIVAAATVLATKRYYADCQVLQVSYDTDDGLGFSK